jgi:hypothetical protein
MHMIQTSRRQRLFALVGAMLCNLSGASIARAQIILRVPGDSPGLPAYARVERPFAFHTDQWAAIVFYRVPECVPANFNLLDFVDIPGAFACPLTVSGFEIWENGPAFDGAPRQVVNSGLAVPVWIVPWPALQSALADDVLTITELTALNPLKGIATTFHELLHPFGPPGTSGGAKVPHLTISASGRLPDGRSFQCEFNDNERMPATKVRITFPQS